MPTEVNIDWSRSGISLSAPYNAKMTLEVYGPTDDVTAIGLIKASQYAAGKPYPDPAYPSFISKGPVLEAVKGLDLRVIRVDYDQPPDGFRDDAVNPLERKPTVEWIEREKMVPVDIDLDNRPIVNGAGDRYSPPTRTVRYFEFVVERFESGFNMAKSKIFGNKVNSAVVTISGTTVGTISVDKEHMRCCGLAPVGKYVADGATQVLMRYRFEVFVDDCLGKYPFQHRFMNEGRNGWYTSTTGTSSGRTLVGPFVTNESPPQSIDNAIRLNLDGSIFPLGEYENVRVGDGKTGAFTPVAKPGDPVTFYKVESLIDAENDGASGWAVYYKETDLVDFSGLGL